VAKRESRRNFNDSFGADVSAQRSHTLLAVRIIKAVLKVLLGVTLGLLLAEFAFNLRDHGAFPHVNFYEEDPQLGVRLRPNASMQLQVAGTNPVTTAATNSRGFRTPEWPARGDNEVVVVGDSQVFGLGVEANETFSAKLSAELKTTVLNAGVPTYGPREYTAVVEQLLAERKPRTVVYVLNLANDLFEVDRPNLQRHRVWDGWAVRSETAPAEVTNFPFRRQLMTRSHLVFALRKWMHSGGAAATEGFATEGSWKDVAAAGSGVTPTPPEDEGARKLLEARAELDRQLEELAPKLEQHIEQAVDENKYTEQLKPLVPKGGDPRDILEVRFAEGARRVELTAYHLFMAAVGEARNDQLLEKIAKQGKDTELLALLEKRRELRAKLDALRPEGEAPHVQPLDTVLLKTKEACDRAGAKLVVVALPLDVMVSAEEWKKYDAPPLDMLATRVLTEDLVARAERIGAVGVDPTAALAAAEPGAFLDGDLHMTPKGHAALAKAIAEAMARPPKSKSTLTLPEGRSWPPTEDEFRRSAECTVKGSTAAGCETKLVREWLRVVCRERDEEAPDGYERLEGVELISGGHGDARIFRVETGVSLLLPLVKGDDVKARFMWQRNLQQLNVKYADDASAPTMWFDKPEKRAKSSRVAYAEWFNPKKNTQGDPLAPPTCPEGQTAGGAMLTCAPACDAQRPCAKGHCEPWPTGSFCATP
jgi:lysophospholipase L1-like esterase